MNVWFGKNSTSQLAAQQMRGNGRSPVANTMLAAYKQFDDIEFLLGILAEPLDDGATDVQVAKIRERHETYRAAMAHEDVVR
jgi:hypothetical protein